MPDSRPTVEADDSPSIDLQILDAQVRALQRNVPSMVVGTLLTAVATVHYFSPVMPEGLDLRRWFAAMLAVSVVRIAAMWLWRRDPAVGRRPAYWARWMVALAVLTGLIWGSLATIYMPTEQSGYRPVMASLLMGVSAAVVVSQVTLYRAFALFLVAMLLPAMLSFAFLPGDVARMLTIMLAFFLLLLLVGGRQSSEASKRSLRLQMELRQLARAEEHARLSAERANAAKSQFLMNMSHELRTPMHAVMAYAQLGVTRCNEPKIRGYLERIHTSASGLLALLGDLLDLARLETGRMEFRIRPKDPLLLVERIAAEFGPQLRHRDVRLEVVVRRRDHPHVDRNRPRAADPVDLPLRQHAQQHHLERRRHVADLVEKHRAAVSHLQPPDALVDRAGERALLVAEQFGLQKLPRDRAAVDRNETLRRAAAVVVQGAGDEFLVGAGLAGDQHGAVGIGGAFDQVEHPQDSRALPDEVVPGGFELNRHGELL